MAVDSRAKFQRFHLVRRLVLMRNRYWGSCYQRGQLRARRQGAHKSTRAATNGYVAVQQRKNHRVYDPADGKQCGACLVSANQRNFPANVGRERAAAHGIRS
jgi:hypothetical protein